MLRSLALALVLASVVGCSYAGIHVRPERLYQRMPRDDTRWALVSQFEVGRSGFTIFGVPIATPNLAAVIETEIQKAGADAVTNLEVETRFQNLFIFASTRYIARGDLIRFDAGGGP